MNNYISHNVYGARAGMSVNCTYYNESPSINIDFAGLRVNGNLSAGCDWDNKISFLITKNEMPYFLGVLLGVSQICSGQYHGDQNNKFFEFELQGDGVYAKAKTNGISLALKISPPDVFNIAVKVFPHIKPLYGFLSVDEIKSLIISTVSRS